jgi:ParB-like chromosome segregation protein Spo0J
MQRDLEIEYRPVDALAPYDQNARTHSPEQIEQIAASIREFGWTNPILVDEEGTIIAGHGRLAAAQALGMAEVPVIVLDDLSDAQRRALVLADNKLALNAGWDDAILAAEVKRLLDDEFDVGVVGFSQTEIDEMLANLDEGGGGGSGGGGGAGGAGSLAERFGVPPFSVLVAREGWWQDRKRAWLALGIQSELGRGQALDDAAPGGSALPAADYGKTKARGDGRGRAIGRG